ncbi:hypothetical protein BRADI_5g10635v3 [Brachypodium distachyon]|uniref:Uncharacterized protein n=1 Tax=Brachypodium distachyon TaxID=15368 RepID=A0A0Q3KRP0_BRADI|nr:hypothetical protein BRADI_5g10635v3 [Brachypodium distachyon]
MTAPTKACSTRNSFLDDLLVFKRPTENLHESMRGVHGNFNPSNQVICPAPALASVGRPLLCLFLGPGMCSGPSIYLPIHPSPLPLFQAPGSHEWRLGAAALPSQHSIIWQWHHPGGLVVGGVGAIAAKTGIVRRFDFPMH